MKEWQFNVLFIVGVGGALFLLIAPAVGLDAVPKNPGAVTGVGVILAYVLNQKRNIISNKHDKKNETDKGEEDTKP